MTNIPRDSAFLEDIIEASYDGIVVIHIDGSIVLVNSAAEKITGLQKNDMLGKNLFDLTAGGGSSEAQRQQWIDHIRTHKRFSFETQFTTPDGRTVYIEQGITSLSEDSGDTPLVIAIIRDITEKKQSEKALREANRFRKQFFTNITHEFRTPLTLIMGPLEDLLRGSFGKISKTAREQVGVVLQSTQRLLKLVNQLLDVTMTEAHLQPPEYEKKDLNMFISAALDAFAAPARNNAVKLEFFRPDNTPELYIDPYKMEKILYDLIGTTLKKTPSGGVLAVTLHDTGGGTESDAEPPSPGRIAVSISNSENPGDIHAEQEYSGESAGSPAAHPETNISLFHAKEMIEVLGGTLSVLQSSDSALTFYIDIPSGHEQTDTEKKARRQHRAPATQPHIELSDIYQGKDALEQRIDGSRPLILIVEDNPAVRKYVSTLVKRKYDFIEAGNGVEALEKLEHYIPDLILCDVMMPEMDGYTLLRTIRRTERFNSIAFIFLTARADTATKIEGLEGGADDYIVKPFNSLELLARIESLLRLRTLMVKSAAQEKKITTLTQKLQEKYYYGQIVGKSSAMRKTYQLLETIKDSDANVLITGETGTGKELIANSIHYNSPRKNAPMVSVNCGAIPRELMESEFFGHAKGAFTGAVEDKKGYFEEASGGTLLLDEIGEMNKDMQVKLLRALERGEITRVGDSSPTRIDVRLIAATNKDLHTEVRKGNFREDLFYRLHVVPIHIPPLRERREDIPLLIQHFLKKIKDRLNTDPPPVTEKDMTLFINHPYPGNVRELENIIERFCLLGSSARTLLSEQPGTAGRMGLNPAYDEVMADTHPLKAACSRTEKELILQTLAAAGNNYQEAAAKLNIGLSSLYRKIKEHGIRQQMI